MIQSKIPVVKCKREDCIMGTRVSRSMVELTPEREAIIKARRHIRPDEPGTNPGEPGNGHVLVIDETHQKFNGQKYHRNNDGYYIINKKVCGKNKMQFLHVNVWQFHNGEKPEGFVVHHNHRDENGQWDKSANDIEHLLLVTYSEHRLYHAKYKPPVVENTDSYSSNEEYSTLEDGRAETEMHVYVPRIEDTQKKVIRYCYYCHRPFEAYESSFETACDRPNCRGKEFIRDYTAALNNVLQDLMKHSDCGFKCFSKQFKEPIHCLFIDDEFWFVAEEICSIFEC